MKNMNKMHKLHFIVYLASGIDKLKFTAYLFLLGVTSVQAKPITSVKYYCPLPPKGIEIGDKLENYWYLNLKKDSYNVVYRAYVRAKGIKFNIERWNGFDTFRKSKSELIIFCCGLDKDSKLAVCVNRLIKASQCLPVVTFNEKERFECSVRKDSS